MSKGKVYLVGIPEDNIYKIGLTKGKVEKRIKGIQTGNPKKVEIIHIFETEYHHKVESWMHRKHQFKRMEGEWFELTHEDIDNFMSDCKEGHEIFKTLIDFGNPFI